MSFGIYVHIPYCLQRCVYCDFATVETTSAISKIVPPMAYIDRVKKEIELKTPHIKPRPLDTIYFGGGTPSAIDPKLLIDVVNSLKENGFSTKSTTEITLEINPGTLVEQNFDDLFKAGFNRFSVGVQTFDDDLLKRANRLHSSDQTRDTLSLLNKNKVNYSADVLFSLPTQPKEGLLKDLEILLEFSPPHVSPYCLTVPEGHPFSHNRAPEDDQVEMFGIIEDQLSKAGLNRYEISNFSKPGFESRHNLLYWNDEEYWGVGNSSHSYIKNDSWGVRFWNPRGLEPYVQHVNNLSEWSLRSFKEDSGEILEKNQALTDFFHTSLRMKKGFSEKMFAGKFGDNLSTVAGPRLEKLMDRGLLEKVESSYRLSSKGILLSNLVFTELTFLRV